MNQSHSARLLLAGSMLLLVTACGGGGGGGAAPPAPPPAQVTAPSIASAPAAVTVDDGAAASFSVTAQGTGPLSYQWSRNGTAIAGATTATLSLDAVKLADHGSQFSVTVSNSAGNATSAPATLSVRAIAISLQTDLPAAVQVDAGTSRSFSVEVRGSQPLTVQWFRDGVPIAGATALTYTMAAPHYGDDGAQLSAQISNFGGSVQSQTSRITVAAKSPKLITSCQEITQSGSYTLDRDIAKARNDDKPCIDIHDTSDVLLDCADHEIANATDAYVEALRIINADRVALRHCRMRADWATLRNTRDISFTDNTIMPGDPTHPSIVNVYNATRLRFDGNQLTGSYQHTYASDSTISNNRVKTVSGQIVAALLTLNWGNNNRVVGNQLDGSWDSAKSPRNGADDGIILADETAPLVKNNQIVDVWDCGIEWVGSLSNATIQGNRVTHSVICGIGGWYFSNVTDSKFLDNVVERTNKLFAIFRVYCPRPAGDDPEKRAPADAGVRFENNRFENNALRVDADTPLEMASYFNYDFPFGTPGACGPGLDDRMPKPSDFHMSGNVFKNNDFGLVQQRPYFSLSLKDAIVDGGGNICATSIDTSPYPLKCNPPPKNQAPKASAPATAPPAAPRP